MNADQEAWYKNRIIKLEAERKAINRALSLENSRAEKLEQSIRNLALDNDRLKRELAQLRSGR